MAKYDIGLAGPFLELYRAVRRDWPQASYVGAALLIGAAGAIVYQWASGWTALLAGSATILVLLVLISILFPRAGEQQPWVAGILRNMFEITLVLAMIIVVFGGLYWAYLHYIRASEPKPVVTNSPRGGNADQEAPSKRGASRPNTSIGIGRASPPGASVRPGQASPPLYEVVVHLYNGADVPTFLIDGKAVIPPYHSGMASLRLRTGDHVVVADYPNQRCVAQFRMPVEASVSASCGPK